MQMFETFLKSIPKNRSEMVEELEIPDVKVSPYMWQPDDSLTFSDSLNSSDEGEIMTYSTDSSIPLSRAMTGSEIDYERSRRYKHRNLSNPWEHLRAAQDAFPPQYLESLKRFQNSSEDTLEPEQIPITYERRQYDEELRQKMKRFFQEECQAFAPDDPGLEEMEDAIADVDMRKVLVAELRERKMRTARP